MTTAGELIDRVGNRVRLSLTLGLGATNIARKDLRTPSSHPDPGQRVLMQPRLSGQFAASRIKRRLRRLHVRSDRRHADLTARPNRALSDSRALTQPLRSLVRRPQP